MQELQAALQMRGVEGLGAEPRDELGEPCGVRKGSPSSNLVVQFDRAVVPVGLVKTFQILVAVS